MPRIDPRFLDDSYGTRQHQEMRAYSLTNLVEIGYEPDGWFIDTCKRALRVAHDFDKSVIVHNSPQECRFGKRMHYALLRDL